MSLIKTSLPGLEQRGTQGREGRKSRSWVGGGQGRNGRRGKARLAGVTGSSGSGPDDRGGKTWSRVLPFFQRGERATAAGGAEPSLSVASRGGRVPTCRATIPRMPGISTPLVCRCFLDFRLMSRAQSRSNVFQVKNLEKREKKILPAVQENRGDVAADEQPRELQLCCDPAASEILQEENKKAFCSSWSLTGSRDSSPSAATWDQSAEESVF